MTDSNAPKKQAFFLSRAGIEVLAFIFVILALVPQIENIMEYQLYFSSHRNAKTIDFSNLSESWSEKTLRAQFPDQELRCEPYMGHIRADRTCAAYVKTMNDIPILYISFFLYADHLQSIAFNIPWWARKDTLNKLEAQYGRATATDLLSNNRTRLIGWQLPNGAALLLNRDIPLNPFAWNNLFWASKTGCNLDGGCFQNLNGQKAANAQ